MRSALVLGLALSACGLWAPVAAFLASAGAAPAAGVPQGGATGGVAVPYGTTGGLVAPRERAAGPRVGPDGGAQAPGPAAGAPDVGAAAQPVRTSTLVVPAQAGPPATAPDAPSPVPPDDGDVDVQVPIDEAPEGPAPSRPTDAVVSSGDLARTGLAVGLFAALGAAVAVAGLGLRRLAR